MRSVLVVLAVFVAQVHAKKLVAKHTGNAQYSGDELVDKVVDKLVGKSVRSNFRQAMAQLLQPLRGLLSRYDAVIQERPLLMNGVTGAILACVGDILCQKCLEQAVGFDWRRNAALTTFGTFYQGVAYYYFIRTYLLFLPAWCKRTHLRKGIGCTIWANFFFAPLMHIPAFYMVTGTIEMGFMAAWQNLKAKWWSTIRVRWMMWPIFGIINYGFVPLQFGAVVQNIFNLIWNVVIDYIAHRSALTSTIGTTTTTTALTKDSLSNQQ